MCYCITNPALQNEGHDSFFSTEVLIMLVPTAINFGLPRTIPGLQSGVH